MEPVEYKQPITVKEPLSTYLYFSSLYFVAVAVLYLWGYWTTFNINILEYLSLADIIKSTAYPIATSFIFIVIGVAIGAGQSITKTALPPGEGRNTKLGRFLHKYSSLLSAIYASGTLWLYALGPVEKWQVLPVLFAIPIFIAAKKRRFLTSLIPDDNSHTIIIFLLALLPAYAYGQGRLQASEILDGKKYKYVVSQIDGASLCSHMSPNQQLRFLGHAGDFIFLLHPSKQVVVITRFDANKTLQLKDFKTTN